MYILRAFVFLAFLAQVVFAQQPTPILPECDDDSAIDVILADPGASVAVH
jgi:hypothetical protein